MRILKSKSNLMSHYVLRCFSILVLSLWLVTCASVDPEMRAQNTEMSLHPYPILQGLTTGTTTQITVLTEGEKNISFKVLNAKNEEVKLDKTQKMKAGPLKNLIYQISLKNLKPKAYYTFQVLHYKNVKDQRRFRTLDLSKNQAKIGVISCMNDSFAKAQFHMWNDYFNLAPDYTFLIGDNVYADIGLKKLSLKDRLWKRYVQTWSELALYRMSRLTPTVAIWDDHDYGVRDGNTEFAQKKLALKILRSFFPLDTNAQALQQTKGAGFVLNAFKQRFVFADARYFRTPKDAKAPTQWGDEQTQEIFKIMQKKKPTWLIEGDQFFGAYHSFESFEGDRPDDFKKVLAKIKKSPSPVFFVSGDRHLAEFMKIEKKLLGYETYELTSSAIHAPVFPNAWKKTPNPRQVYGKSGVFNYAVVTTTKTEKDWRINAKSYGPKMQLLYNANVKIKK